MEANRLEPSREADRRTLIRRVCLDLTGLPPSPRVVERFVNDTGPGAYEKLVDSLLASERYGETDDVGVDGRRALRRLERVSR